MLTLRSALMTGLWWVSDLTRVIFQALTGEVLPDDRAASDDLAAVFQEQGFGRDRLVELKQARQSDGLPWPWPVTSLSGEVGAAQALAAVKAAVVALGVEEERRVRRPGIPDAATRRLLDDVPPHHGSVG